MMSFGLTNVLSSFHKVINKILVEKFDIFVIMYLNDILMYTYDNGDCHVTSV